MKRQLKYAIFNIRHLLLCNDGKSWIGVGLRSTRFVCQVISIWNLLAALMLIHYIQW